MCRTLYAACRWKAVAEYDTSLPGLVMFGGDAAREDLPHKGYLNDMWWLPTNESLPVWHQPVLQDPEDRHKKPSMPASPSASTAPPVLLRERASGMVHFAVCIGMEQRLVVGYTPGQRARHPACLPAMSHHGSSVCQRTSV